jgi:transposase InsO family protein
MEAGLQISMTEEMHCYENAMVERVNGILKQEYYIGSCFRNKEQAKEAVKEAVYLFHFGRSPNRLRRLFKLDKTDVM